MMVRATQDNTRKTRTLAFVIECKSARKMRKIIRKLSKIQTEAIQTQGIRKRKLFVVFAKPPKGHGVLYGFAQNGENTSLSHGSWYNKLELDSKEVVLRRDEQYGHGSTYNKNYYEGYGKVVENGQYQAKGKHHSREIKREILDWAVNEVRDGNLTSQQAIKEHPCLHASRTQLANIERERDQEQKRVGVCRNFAQRDKQEWEKDVMQQVCPFAVQKLRLD